LDAASERGHIHIVRWLIEQKTINLNLGDDLETSPLSSASIHGYDSVVEILLHAGADVNHENFGGTTAFIWASSMGHTSIMRNLITAGARINHTNNTGCTALDFAQFRGHTTTVELLLSHRALPGTKTTLPPLHTRLLRPTDAPFTMSPDERAPEVLSQTDVFGRTALHYAALKGDYQSYKLLYTAMMEAGVDTEGVDGGGFTAFYHLVSPCVCVFISVFFITIPPRASHHGLTTTTS
jgi:ankyrin repeat protein